jgi:dolichol-phosphate mannosyltransferase
MAKLTTITSDTWAKGKKIDGTWEYPAFEIREINKKKNDFCVCIFVINEGEKVQKQLARMKKYAKDIDIIVADGGSTDGSLEDDTLTKNDVRALLTKRGPGKLSAQMRMAFAYALTEGYKGVVVVDGNGKDDITAIPNFVKHLKEGYDHIQGSRYIPGGKAINTPWERHYALKLLHAPLLSWAAGYKHTDTTNGFRGYSAKLLSDKDLAIFRDIFATYELHYYLSVKSARHGYKLTEIPVTREYPKTGKTPTKISPIKGNLHVLGILFKAAFNKYDPPKK